MPLIESRYLSDAEWASSLGHIPTDCRSYSRHSEPALSDKNPGPIDPQAVSEAMRRYTARKINVWRPKGLGYWASLNAQAYGGECSLDGLIWVGMVGIADPLRPRMNEIVDVLHRAGIRGVILT